MQNEGGSAETQHAATTPIADPFAWFRYRPEERTGSEGGTIVADEEIPDVCRITLEARCPIAPYAITCGVYDGMVHTTWASSANEAHSKYEGMKRDLRDFATGRKEADFGTVTEWISNFVEKWQ